MQRALLFVLVGAIGVGGCGGRRTDGSASGSRDVAGLEGTACSVLESGYYYIGVILPTSGVWKPWGLPSVEAIRFARAAINADGGIAGKRLGLVVCDSGADADAARAQVDAVAGLSPVSLMLGPLATIQAEAMIEPAAAAKVALVSGCATGAALTGGNLATEAAETRFFYRTAPSEALVGMAAARLAMAAGQTNLAVVLSSGDVALDAVATAFAATLGVSPTRVSDLAALPLEVDGALILLDAAAVVAQLPGADNRGTWYLAPWAQSAGVAAAGAASGGDWLRGLRLQPVGDEVLSPFAADLLDFIGDTTLDAPLRELQCAVQHHDATYLAAAAMTLAADPASGASVAAALGRTASGSRFEPSDWVSLQADVAAARKAGELSPAIDYVGLSGEVDFDARGDVRRNIEIWGVADGTFVLQGCVDPLGAAGCADL